MKTHYGYCIMQVTEESTGVITRRAIYVSNSLKRIREKLYEYARGLELQGDWEIVPPYYRDAATIANTTTGEEIELNIDGVKIEIL